MSTTKKLFLIHCGYYEKELFGGIYESHGNFFVVADSMQEARIQAKNRTEFKSKRMHIDGIQELNMIDGHRIVVEKDTTTAAESGDRVESYGYDMLKNLSRAVVETKIG